MRLEVERARDPHDRGIPNAVGAPLAVLEIGDVRMIDLGEIGQLPLRESRRASRQFQMHY